MFTYYLTLVGLTLGAGAVLSMLIFLFSYIAVRIASHFQKD